MFGDNEFFAWDDGLQPAIQDSKRQTVETVCLICPVLGGATNCPGKGSLAVFGFVQYIHSTDKILRLILEVESM